MKKGGGRIQRLEYRRLERTVRGFSNHRRIQMLELLSEKPELSVIEIAKELNINFKTAAEHIRRLAITGLVMKRSDYKSVRHKLTPRGETILMFLRTLE
ncbi:MAG: winged helix-turn-helix domain-containing protein [bacterium]|nr:winged helix-turn-helix domain-containing protein [bacterium]